MSIAHIDGVAAATAAGTTTAHPEQAVPRHGLGLQWSRINLTVVGVLALFAYLYWVDVLLVIVPWLTLFTVPGVTNLAILTFTTAVSLYSYLFCVVVDPGSVPADWRPDEEQLTVTEVKRKGGTHRVCQKCSKFKPPRTHHCRVCRRCVLRMDHHCPWMNNCLGQANYRAFIIFLIYVCAALMHTVGLVFAHALHAVQVKSEQRHLRVGPQSKAVNLQGGWGSGLWVWAAAQSLALMVSLPLCLGLLMLLAWHVHLVASNKTTIEYQEGVRAAVQSGVFTSLHEHPYDVGLCGNLHDIMGETPADWCLPPRQPTPGGTRFATAWDDRVLGLT